MPHPRLLTITIAAAAALFAAAQTDAPLQIDPSLQQAEALSPTGTPRTLEECRQQALASNRSLKMQRESVRKADYLRKQARSAWLPGVDFAGGYTYNQKKISIFDSDQLLPTKTFNPATGSYDFNILKNPATGMPVMHDGSPIPTTVALIPKEAMTYDIHNVFFGALTLTQPIFMGGKIRALNRLADYNRQLQEQLVDNSSDDIIYEVDAAYWQVVSLKAKYRLAVSYVNLLDTLQRNVKAMLDQGVATRSDLLSVDVKLNQANVDLTKVENGVTLSRMALAQKCGLPVDTVFPLADENINRTCLLPEEAQLSYNMADVYARRPDMRALDTGVRIFEQQAAVARSEMMPKLALVGAYTFSNPNMFDGFKKRFNGAFSVGATLTVPIWHWGGNYYAYKAAQTEVTIARMKVQDAHDLVDLQVSQAAYRRQEAIRTYTATTTNLEKADENLRCAELGFHEGVMTPEKVMEAQTAWLKANSEQIDAMIDVRLCEVYLRKVLGTLNN